MTESVKGSAVRASDHSIDPLFLDRWSPRAMSGAALSPEVLLRLFEAARWAPSAFNAQPWRFLYATRDSEHWPVYLGLLAETNRLWCDRAAALVLFASRALSEHNGKPARTHAFDCGAAWENFALQGTREGLVVHGMAGFDAARARELLRIPPEFEIQAMAAVGLPGDPQTLPENLRARETPNDRRPLAETVFEGSFPG